MVFMDRPGSQQLVGFIPFSHPPTPKNSHCIWISSVIAGDEAVAASNSFGHNGAADAASANTDFSLSKQKNQRLDLAPTLHWRNNDLTEMPSKAKSKSKTPPKPSTTFEPLSRLMSWRKFSILAFDAPNHLYIGKLQRTSPEPPPRGPSLPEKQGRIRVDR